MFLRPDLPVLRRPDGSLQVGTCWPAIAIFTEEWNGLADFLDAAAAGVALEQAASCLEPEVFTQVYERLSQQQMVIATRHLQGEDRCWQRVNEEFVGVWKEHAVAFDGLSALSWRCVEALVECGLNGFRFHDNSRVDATDLGAYPQEFLQHRRADAAALLLNQRYQIAYVPAPLTQLTIVTSAWLMTLQKANSYAALDTPYLTVTWSETEIQVGPLYRPGVSACARCAFAQRTQADPTYALIVQQAATQLTPRCETTLQLRAAAFVAQVTSQFLAGFTTAADNACWHFSQADPIPRFEALQPSAECGCLQLGEAPSGIQLGC